MSDYRIMTESTADLTPELIQTLDVTVIPMEFIIDGQSYLNYPDEHDMTHRKFYELLRAGKTSTTSQIGTGRFIELFEPVLQSGSDLLYIGFSSGLSGTFACAQAAVEELAKKYPDRRIFAVDSLAASLGEGLLVYNAVMQKRAGLNIGELAAWVTANRNHLCHWFTVDDLNHLKRGGRISPTAALFGTMLGIKPVLHVDDEGHLIPVEKVRGHRQSLDALLSHMEKTIVNPQDQMIFISHADSPEGAQYVAKQVRAKFKPKDVSIGYIGPVIGAHAGAGTVALFYLGKDKN